MKLDKFQREKVESFLSYINEHDLMSLSRTVTNNLLHVETVSDAVQAIIQHEVDLKSLLLRRKVTREVLFKYLHDNLVDISSNSEKSALVSTVLEIWHENFSSEVSSLSSYLDASKQVKEHAPSVITLHQTPSAEHVGDVNMLAEKFAAWFYSNLNGCMLSQHSEKLCIEHFWNDCSLHVVMESATESIVRDVYKNASGVVNLLKDILNQHKLYFNPNISQSGTRGKVDAHGLVIVAACGTLHQVNNCVGIFKQIFGLLRDPFMENNWRIKSSSIFLKSVENSSMPNIEYEHLNLSLPE